MVFLFCKIVGMAGGCFEVDIDKDLPVGILKELIQKENPNDLAKVDPDTLELFVAKKADGSWLCVDPSFEEVNTRMKEGLTPQKVRVIIDDKTKRLSPMSTISQVFTVPAVDSAAGQPVVDIPSGYLHVLVVPPRGPEQSIHIKENQACREYMEVAEHLKNSKEVVAVVETLWEIENARKSESNEQQPFVVLESSSGTGKTQMAFNLVAHGEFDVFYFACVVSRDIRQAVYGAFENRRMAFEACLQSDLRNVEGDGSIGMFRSDSTRLKVYAFILAALENKKHFRGDAVRSDVLEVCNRRSKPFVFFLDEFPRIGNEQVGTGLEARTALLRAMRNVFRSLGIPLIISSTNSTARDLFTLSDSSRPSGNPEPWCVVVPSLPRFPVESVPEEVRDTVFGWILQHSRPLFAVRALKYLNDMKEKGYDLTNTASSSDQLQLLRRMAQWLTVKFRRFKQQSRPDEFEDGQLCLFLGSSYVSWPEHDAQDELDDSSDGEDEEVNSSEEDEEMDGSDAEAETVDGGTRKITFDADTHGETDTEPDGGCGREKALDEGKKINLIDGHYARLREQEMFLLEMGEEGLQVGDVPWTCRCVFPKPEDDILLFLTLMGEYLVDRERCSPLNRRFYRKLRRALASQKVSCRGRQATNDGMALEALVAGSVVLASHVNGFCGVWFRTFFSRLLYELGVCGKDQKMKVPKEMWKLKLPFLSPPTVKWPSEFLAYWKDTDARFGNMERTLNKDMIGFQAVPCDPASADRVVLTGECNDWKQNLPGSEMEKILERVPESSNIHLVVVKHLQNKYFTTQTTEQTTEFLKECGLLHADFYRMSKKKELIAFPELMSAREQTHPASKTVIFIAVGEWNR